MHELDNCSSTENKYCINNAGKIRQLIADEIDLILP